MPMAMADSLLKNSKTLAISSANSTQTTMASIPQNSWASPVVNAPPVSDLSDLKVIARKVNAPVPTATVPTATLPTATVRKETVRKEIGRNVSVLKAIVPTVIDDQDHARAQADHPGCVIAMSSVLRAVKEKMTANPARADHAQQSVTVLALADRRSCQAQAAGLKSSSCTSITTAKADSAVMARTLTPAPKARHLITVNTAWDPADADEAIQKHDDLAHRNTATANNGTTKIMTRRTMTTKTNPPKAKKPASKNSSNKNWKP